MIEQPEQMEICEISPDGEQIYVRLKFSDGAIIEGWHEAKQIRARASGMVK